MSGVPYVNFVYGFLIMKPTIILFIILYSLFIWIFAENFKTYEIFIGTPISVGKRVSTIYTKKGKTIIWWGVNSKVIQLFDIKFNKTICPENKFI